MKYLVGLAIIAIAVRHAVVMSIHRMGEALRMLLVRLRANRRPHDDRGKQQGKDEQHTHRRSLVAFGHVRELPLHLVDLLRLGPNDLAAQ